MNPNITDEQLLATLKRLERVADLSDSRFRIPFTQIRFGIDALIGLIPVLGETIGLVISMYILREASRLGVPRSLKLKMLGNMLLDWLVGLIPVIGDIADIAFRANVRNMKLLVTHLDQERMQRANQEGTQGAQTDRLAVSLLYAVIAIILLVASVYAIDRYWPV